MRAGRGAREPYWNGGKELKFVSAERLQSRDWFKLQQRGFRLHIKKEHSFIKTLSHQTALPRELIKLHGL